MVGIYKIYNKENQKVYIGSSNDVERRFSIHRKKLKNDDHINEHLQNSWNKYGEDSFEFEVIDEVGVENLREKEQEYINEYNSIDSENGYNIKNVGLEKSTISSSSKTNLSARIKREYGEYLDEVSENKSKYVEKLIKEDKKKRGMEGRSRLEEIQKCQKDPIHFIEAHCRIKDPKSTVPSYIDLYDYQKEVINELQNGKWVLLVKGRQIGASTLMSLYSLWKNLFQFNKGCGIKSCKQDISKNILHKYRFAYENIPGWLQKQSIRDTMLNKEYRDGSGITVLSENGRAKSLDFVGIDEASFVYNLQDVWTSLLPCLDVSGDGECLVATNGIHRESENFDILRDFYEMDEFEVVKVPFSQIHDQSSIKEQRKILGSDKYIKENGAVVHDRKDENKK